MTGYRTRRRVAAELARAGTKIIPASPQLATAQPLGRRPDVALAAANAAGQHRHTKLFLTPPALPCPRDRLAELRTPELPDLDFLSAGI